MQHDPQPFSNSTPQNPDAATPAEPLASIEYRDLLWLHDFHLKDKQVLLSKHIGKPGKPSEGETKWIWYSRAEIIDFLQGVIDDKDVSGIKLYLCSYPDKISAGPSGAKFPHKASYVKQLTISLVATQDKAGDPTTDYPEKAGKKLFVPPPQNNGRLCPPDCS